MTDIVERLKDADAATHALFDYIFQDARKEIERLRAKIKEMEQQEPVAIQHRVPSVDLRGECVGYSEWKDGKGLDHWPRRTLYALPGAQPAPSVPDGWKLVPIEPTIAMCLAGDKPRLQIGDGTPTPAIY
jgi:hypothetical protein